MGNQVMDVHQAFRDVCYGFGVEKLAGMMGMSAGVLYNKCNCNENESNFNKPSGRDMVLATLLTNDKRIPQAFCQTVGGVFVDLPDLSDLSTDALITHLLKIQEANGLLHSEIRRALEGDDQIDRDEFKAIKEKAMSAIVTYLEALARIDEMSGGAK